MVASMSFPLLVTLVNELSGMAALITTGARISAALLSPLCFGAAELALGAVNR